jgi:ADP-dependent NAD(P)H-hydrate dehydratase / NAD(P)H-hydrate epimerase
MLSVATTSQIRKLEADWISKCDTNWGQVLMELAGQQAAKLAYNHWLVKLGRVLIVCGSGNNGGDGLVIARYLHLWQVPVVLNFVNTKGSSNEFSMSTKEGNINRGIAKTLGIEMKVIDKATSLDVKGVTMIIDALLGTGVDREVEGLYKSVIECVNEIGLAQEVIVVAVDVPSGINTDNGQIMGAAIKADATATFGYIKSGLLCHPAAELCGELSLIDIGLPPLAAHSPEIFLSTMDYIFSLIPERKANSNKGTFGTLLTIAGSAGMTGAAFLSSRSSLRVGAGLVLLATAKSVLEHLPPGEVIYKPLPETNEQTIDNKAVDEVMEYIKTASAVVLGPGLTTNASTVLFVRQFLIKMMDKKEILPCLIDADALNALSTFTEIMDTRAKPFILTPHPKELSRLTGQSTQDIQADRINAALNAANKFGCIIVLKGAHSVIANPDGRVFVNPTGNASMAKAGAGDVLSGIMGGLLAQKIEPFLAAIAGTYIHGLAGEKASLELGMSSVLANDISLNISGALEQITNKEVSDFEETLLEWTI